MAEYQKPKLVKGYNSLEGLKEFMSVAKTVSAYNELREDAKRFFSNDLINRLDQSAYIVKLLGRHNEK